jgi:hypothetical protein
MAHAGQVTRVANNNIQGASSGNQGGVLYNGPSASTCASGSGAVASIAQFLLNTIETFRSGELSMVFVCHVQLFLMVVVVMQSTPVLALSCLLLLNR